MARSAQPRPQTVRVLTAKSTEELTPDRLPALFESFQKGSTTATWIHAERDVEVVDALAGLGIDELLVRRLHRGVERPRVEEFADHLYISLLTTDPVRISEKRGRAAPDEVGAYDEDAPAPRIRELRVFLGPCWLVSLGHIHPEDYGELAERMRRQVFARDRGASFMLYHLCDWLVERLQPVLEDLDDRIDRLEDQVVLTTDEQSMRILFAFKRDLVDLRRRVAPLRDVMQRLGSHGVIFLEPEAEIYFRDVHDDVTRVIELLDTYRDILSSALDLHLSSVSNKLNQVMKQLTVVATMFMPLSFIVGFFGMNFTSLPWASRALFSVMWALLAASVIGMVIYRYAPKLRRFGARMVSGARRGGSSGR